MNFAKLLKIIFNRTALCDCFCNFNIAKARFSFYCALFTNLRYFLNILPKSVNYIVYINIYYILYIYYINYILSIYIYICIHIYNIYIYLYSCFSNITEITYHTSAWVFSRKFAAYFQNTFF